MKVALRAIRTPPTRSSNPMGHFEYLIQVLIRDDSNPDQQGLTPKRAHFLVGKDDHNYVLCSAVGTETLQELVYAVAFDNARGTFTTISDGNS